MHSMLIRNTTCCGLTEAYSLSLSPKMDAREIIVQRIHGGGRHSLVLFTDTVRSGRGNRLAEYVRANRLGEVTETPPKRNPNSGNYIQAWIWALDYQKCRSWLSRNS